MPNARLSERAPFFAEVDVLAANAPAPKRVWGTDVSESGMFLQTTHPFRVGERVSLRFDVKQHAVHVRAAEVMWVRPFEPVSVDGKLPGVGIRFVALDPPARAALRKFVHPHCDESTLPEAHGAANDDVAAHLKLPPPTASLPPITGSILAKTRDERAVNITDEMLAVSLPPFTELPKQHLKTPKNAKRAVTEPMGTPPPSSTSKQQAQPPPVPPQSSPPQPRPITIAPRPVTHPFAGWKFRRADDDIQSLKPIADSIEPTEREALPEAAVECDDIDVDIAEPSAPPAMNMRFDDSAPADVVKARQARADDDAGFNELFADSPAPPGSRDEYFDPRDTDVTDPGGPVFADAPGIVEHEEADKLDDIHAGVVEGTLAIRHIPIASDRMQLSDPPPTARKRAKRARVLTLKSLGDRALPLALVLLFSGTLVGVTIGVIGKRIKRQSPAIAQATSTEAPAPAPAAPIEEPTPAPSAPARVADVERELAQPAQPATTDAKAAEEATLASAVARADRDREEGAKRPAKSAKGVRNVDVRVGPGATLTKAFTLSEPSRVVVDVVGGKLPKEPLFPGDGISRVRFGSPAKGTSRVVVELAGDARAEDLEASIKRGTLKIAFRSPTE